MNSFTIGVLSVVAFVALIQPCPAPPAIAAIAAAASTALGSAVVSGVVGGTVSAGVGTGIGAATKHHKRDGTEETTTPSFRACMGDIVSANPPLMLVGQDSVVLNGLPGSCIDRINMYNSHPQIDELNAMHGHVTIINSTAVQLSGMSDHLLGYVQGLAKQTT